MPRFLLNNEPTYSVKRLLLASIIWWTFWTLLQTIVLHRLELEWNVAFIDSVVSNILLSLLGFLMITIYRFYQPGKNARFFRFVYAIGITLLYCVALKWSLSSIVPGKLDYLDFLEKSMPIRFICALFILSFITILNWLWNIMKDQKEKDERRSEAEQLVKEAELVKLRQQLQPHFLFNSLNSISALAGSKPDEARKMIQQLSDFLRGTLKKDEQRTVAVEEELEHLGLYLDIEKVRFGHRLNVEIEFTDDALNQQIPPLLLQPIVENAIKFGLYGTIGDITVKILGKAEGNLLLVKVINPFDPETQNVGKGTGFGLSSIQRRLFLLYGRNDLLATEKNQEQFITRLKIPQV
ncbi:MAG: histidine kinase [Bacteroidia bacterium]|nr:histidine kinase [Bacteroidia bacterium]